MHRVFHRLGVCFVEYVRQCYARIPVFMFRVGRVAGGGDDDLVPSPCSNEGVLGCPVGGVFWGLCYEERREGCGDAYPVWCVGVCVAVTHVVESVGWVVGEGRGEGLLFCGVDDAVVGRVCAVKLCVWFCTPAPLFVLVGFGNSSCFEYFVFCLVGYVGVIFGDLFEGVFVWVRELDGGVGLFEFCEG